MSQGFAMVPSGWDPICSGDECVNLSSLGQTSSSLCCLRGHLLGWNGKARGSGVCHSAALIKGERRPEQQPAVRGLAFENAEFEM